MLGLVCGGVAARSYNDGATAYVQSATSPDVSLSIVPADVVERTLLSAPPTN